MALVAALLVGSLARAEPSRPKVVIDPGHGGSNTGAPGRAPGAFEKQVTLAVARALQRRLEREGVEVMLTRQRDVYLTLRERVRRANAAAPDCFVSLHANASPDHGRRGIETYVLAREPAEVEARRAAARVSGVEQLLVEVRRLDAHRASVTLALSLQSRLATNDNDRGVKQAAYDVLAGVDAPAVLVELGFIDHPVEGVQLLRRDVQERLAQRLADGLFDFLAARRGPRYAAR
jgi:N-acetylmuramoyl-L-alanine amidase